MKKQNRILLVEDDKRLGYILKEYLDLHDYKVTLAEDGGVGWQQFEEYPFDLCILDVMMPKMDGFSLAKEIRTVNKQIPIIFLTSRSLKIDKLKGFKIGADDYIVKPVDEEELILRIEAILRRTANSGNINDQEPDYSIGNYSFDPGIQSLKMGGSTKVLTKLESDLLTLLCENKNRILDRNLVLKQLWAKNDYFTRRSMDVFISRLRSYLSKDPAVNITNVHGKGFVLSVDDGMML